MVNRVNCGNCGNGVLESTASRHNGLCKVCFQKPRTYRWASLWLFVFAGLTGLLGFISWQDFRRLEAEGGELRAHRLIIVIYEAGGLIGITMFFTLATTALLCLAGCLAWNWLRWQSAIDRSMIHPATKSDHD